MTTDPTTDPAATPPRARPTRARITAVVLAATRNGDTDLVVPAVRKRIVDGFEQLLDEDGVEALDARAAAAALPGQAGASS